MELIRILSKHSKEFGSYFSFTIEMNTLIHEFLFLLSRLLLTQMYSNINVFLSKGFDSLKSKHFFTGAAEYEKSIKQEDSFNMMKTVIIAVCSAGAYLALVIGLTAFCSYRLLMQRRNRKAFAPSKNDKCFIPSFVVSVGQDT